jgi:hypothetical protein
LDSDSAIPTMAVIMAIRTVTVMDIHTTAVITQTRTTPIPMRMARTLTAIQLRNSSILRSSISTDHPRNNSSNTVRNMVHLAINGKAILSSRTAIRRLRRRTDRNRTRLPIMLHRNRLPRRTTTSPTASGIALATLVLSRELVP